jgi:hypothetical protein
MTLRGQWSGSRTNVPAGRRPGTEAGPGTPTLSGVTLAQPAMWMAWPCRSAT